MLGRFRPHPGAGGSALLVSLGQAGSCRSRRSDLEATRRSLCATSSCARAFLTAIVTLFWAFALAMTTTPVAMASTSDVTQPSATTEVSTGADPAPTADPTPAPTGSETSSTNTDSSQAPPTDPT